MRLGIGRWRKPTGQRIRPFDTHKGHVSTRCGLVKVVPGALDEIEAVGRHALQPSTKPTKVVPGQGQYQEAAMIIVSGAAYMSAESK